MSEKEDRDLLVWHVADVNGAMNPVAWLVPIDLSGCDFNVLSRAAIAKFDCQNVSFEDD
jgi:hypothetical protein